MEEEWLENSMQSFLTRERERETRMGRGKKRQRILTNWQSVEQRRVRGWRVKNMKW